MGRQARRVRESTGWGSRRRAAAKGKTAEVVPVQRKQRGKWRLSPVLVFRARPTPLPPRDKHDAARRNQATTTGWKTQSWCLPSGRPTAPPVPDALRVWASGVPVGPALAVRGGVETLTGGRGKGEGGWLLRTGPAWPPGWRGLFRLASRRGPFGPGSPCREPSPCWHVHWRRLGWRPRVPPFPVE